MSFSTQTTTDKRKQNSQDLINNDDQETLHTVPVVLLVVEGDLDTIKQGFKTYFYIIEIILLFFYYD